jgi:hypothetical protein
MMKIRLVKMFDTTKRIREEIRATPAPNLMFLSGVASEKMKIAIIRAE